MTAGWPCDCSHFSSHFPPHRTGKAPARLFIARACGADHELVVRAPDQDREWDHEQRGHEQSQGARIFAPAAMPPRKMQRMVVLSLGDVLIASQRPVLARYRFLRSSRQQFVQQLQVGTNGGPGLGRTTSHGDEVFVRVAFPTHIRDDRAPFPSRHRRVPTQLLEIGLRLGIVEAGAEPGMNTPAQSGQLRDRQPGQVIGRQLALETWHPQKRILGGSQIIGECARLFGCSQLGE